MMETGAPYMVTITIACEKVLGINVHVCNALFACLTSYCNSQFSFAGANVEMDARVLGMQGIA